MENLLTPIPVNPTEFGLDTTKANELIGNLPQIKSERDVLEQQYNEVVRMDIENPETSKLAKELRKKIKDNRTKGIEVWHKTTKEFFLRGGQFVDAIKRMESAVNERMETSLEGIEKHFELMEIKRKSELKEKRISEINQFFEFVPIGIEFGELSEDDYKKLLTGAKLQFEAKQEEIRKAEQERIEAEKKAEEERIAKEKAEAEERERIRLENERLKAEAEAKEKQLAEERAKAEEERKRIENEEKKKREELEAKAKKQKEEAEAKLKAEREAKEKLEAELKAKREAEEKAEKERLAEIEKQKKEAEKLAKAPIKKQLSVWVSNMNIGEAPLIDNPGKSIAENIQAKFMSFKKWAQSEVDNL